MEMVVSLADSLAENKAALWMPPTVLGRPPPMNQVDIPRGEQIELFLPWMQRMVAQR